MKKNIGCVRFADIVVKCTAAMFSRMVDYEATSQETKIFVCAPVFDKYIETRLTCISDH